MTKAFILRYLLNEQAYVSPQQMAYETQNYDDFAPGVKFGQKKASTGLAFHFLAMSQLEAVANIHSIVTGSLPRFLITTTQSGETITHLARSFVSDVAHFKSQL